MSISSDSDIIYSDTSEFTDSESSINSGGASEFIYSETSASLSFEEYKLDSPDERYPTYEDRDKGEFEKQCSEYEYMPVILPPQRRVIVIGDLHGDYELTLRCLKLGKVIDDNNNWIGSDTIVVQIGDQVDRCRPRKYGCEDKRETINDEGSDIKIMKLFTDLHKQAKKDGGAVYSLIGNHELLNVMGNLSYVSYQGLEEFKDYKDPENPDLKFKDGKEARKYAFAPGKEYGRFMGCTRSAMVLIGSFLFVHAGLSPEFSKKFGVSKKDDLYRMNYYVRKWLLGLADDRRFQKLVGSEKYSIFWDRVLGSLPEGVDKTNPICVEYLDNILEVFKAKGIIIGHTPQFIANKGINSTCDKSVWRVDNGASAAFHAFDKKYTSIGSVMDLRGAQVLEILNDKEINVLKE